MPFADGSIAVQIEGSQRLGKGRAALVASIPRALLRTKMERWSFKVENPKYFQVIGVFVGQCGAGFQWVALSISEQRDCSRELRQARTGQRAKPIARKQGAFAGHDAGMTSAFEDLQPQPRNARCGQGLYFL